MKVMLCYASKRKINDDENLLEDIIDILTLARKFNQENEIYGVLYYADNAFFQCLEGEQSTIESLYRNIEKDIRHHCVKRLCIIEIEKFRFKKWSMKYVEKDSMIDHYFKENGIEKFDPQKLDLHHLSNFIETLITVNQTNRKNRTRTGFNNRGITPFL
ncbi:BLUF domain-containing protein [Acinetobacter qingfengensis]|uniref:BLUF domain-containing protein n=1 Tax=Acinetobacter qingfengensis TaxID=1262585 RepID=A0A1E7R962_9GAMM|nr:BLUF domain-containing protein [Acinetobacter qingfengensis]KAA8735486.1 BLUF domain-containing protein [Acinetobacter qingfengensis]OEY95868.1 hypothetical protein BJI46_02830 [Acinetobacter qingfengensis]